jgi:hypothetical protein
LLHLKDEQGLESVEANFGEYRNGNYGRIEAEISVMNVSYTTLSVCVAVFEIWARWTGHAE